MHSLKEGVIVITLSFVCLSGMPLLAQDSDPNSPPRYRTVQTRDPQTGRTITQQVPIVETTDSDPNLRTVTTCDPQTGRLITQRVPRQPMDYATMIQQRLERSQTQLRISDEKWPQVKPLLEKVLNLQWAVGTGANYRNRAISTGMLRPGQQPRDRVMRDAAPEDVGNPDKELKNAFDALLEVTRSPEATDEQIAEAMQTYTQKRRKLELELAAAREELKAQLTTRQQAQLILEGVLE